jgi:hypothetical protein
MPLFYGSLDEAIGPLTGFANEGKAPYLLLDAKVEKKFVLAVPGTPDPKCRKKAEIFSCSGVSSSAEDTHSFLQVKKGIVCDGDFTWDQLTFPYPLEKKDSGSAERGWFKRGLNRLWKLGSFGAP